MSDCTSVHLLGDYAILLSTGMKWYIAALYNLLSALTAVVGMFVGVAISNVSEAATSWIFIIAAGIFLYVALVDMVSFCSALADTSVLCMHVCTHTCILVHAGANYGRTKGKVC